MSEGWKTLSNSIPPRNFATLKGRVLDACPHAPQAVEVLACSDEKWSEWGRVVPMRPVLLVGPPGCGKSTVARLYHEMAGYPVKTINVSGMTDALSLMGVHQSFGEAKPSLVTEWMASTELANPRISQAEERAGTFFERIVGLKPDIVIDLISFNLAITRSLVVALHGEIGHFLHCSTLWVYGPTAAVPAVEDEPLNPFGEYCIDKSEIEKWLMHEARTTGFPATIFRPSQIVGEECPPPPDYAPREQQASRFFQNGSW